MLTDQGGTEVALLLVTNESVGVESCGEGRVGMVPDVAANLPIDVLRGSRVGREASNGVADADAVGIIGRHERDGDGVTLCHVEASLGDLFLVGGSGGAQEGHRSVVVGARARPECWFPADGRKEWGWKSHLECSVRTGVLLEPFVELPRLAIL